MIAQVISNRFDNVLREFDICPKKMVEQPTNLPKDKCSLVKFVTVLPSSNGKRTQENYDKVLALELDFDSNVSIKEFQERYSKFEYYLYTTSSHSKHNNKFRVIVPLKFPVSFRVYSDKLFLECLTIFWEGIDVSSFKNFHNMPNKPQNGEEYYYKINTGEFWSFELLEKNYKRLERKKKSIELLRKMQKDDNKKNSNLSEHQKNCYKNAVLENIRKELKAIPQYQNGSRYNSLVSVTGKMCSAKYPDGEYIFELWDIKDWIIGHTKGKNVENMVEQIFRKRG